MPTTGNRKPKTENGTKLGIKTHLAFRVTVCRIVIRYSIPPIISSVRALTTSSTEHLRRYSLLPQILHSVSPPSKMAGFVGAEVAASSPNAKDLDEWLTGYDWSTFNASNEHWLSSGNQSITNPLQYIEKAGQPNLEPLLADAIEQHSQAFQESNMDSQSQEPRM
jgi:hypothetical protein